MTDPETTSPGLGYGAGSRSRLAYVVSGVRPIFGFMEVSVRELSPIETHDLRRRVSAAGRISLPSWDHELDEAPGSWHLGAIDSQGKVVAIATFFQLSCPYQPEVAGAYRLQFMAVEPSLQRVGLGTRVLTEGIRRLRTLEAQLLWATARTEAVPFYKRFGFAVVPALGSETTDQPTILLDLTA